MHSYELIHRIMELVTIRCVLKQYLKNLHDNDFEN